jgi:PTH1 family peptidyl-tRNA hydrolase
VDHLRARWHLDPFRRGQRARETRGDAHGRPVRLLKPQTDMNRSGAALTPLLDAPDFDPARDLLVLVDDVATDLGRFRLRGAGSSGGHNGLKSIEGVLRRQDYARLRIGVGPVRPDTGDLADFVLGAFSRAELAAVTELLDTMADAVETWMTEGIEKAMSRFNR